MSRNNLTVFAVLALFFIFAVPGKGNAFCFEEAGSMYGVSPQLLWAIAKVESGFNPAAVNYNRNGTYDFGVMQINSSWRPRLGKLWDYLGDPCTNIKVGAWVLAQCVRKYGYTWDAVGCYSTGSGNSKKGAKYVKKIYLTIASTGVIR
ncbi:MAG: lytic transglycosylase domain-containing protein [Candidatus Aenigmatarchaeota archaeon]